MAKRISAKAKLDKQLTGQTFASPFISIRDGTNRKVSFNTRDELGNRIDKLTVMLGRLAAKDNHDKRPFKPQIYQGRGRGQNRNFNQRSYQDRTGLIIGQVVEIEGSLETGPGLNRITEGGIFEAILGDMVDRIAEGTIEIMTIDITITIEAEIGQGRGHSQ